MLLGTCPSLFHRPALWLTKRYRGIKAALRQRNPQGFAHRAWQGEAAGTVRVNHLADMYVASDALQGDRAIGIQPSVGAEQIAHHQRRHFRRLIQCRGGGIGVAGIGRDRLRQRIGAAFDDVHFHLNHALDFQAGDADFAVAHRRVQIAHR